MQKITQRTISAFARQVAKQFNPQKIVLFGSYAYGEPTEDSEVDILVIMPFNGRNLEKATEIWMATKLRFLIDIMVRKPGELKKRLKMGIFSCERLPKNAKCFMKPLTSEWVEKAEKDWSSLQREIEPI